jgi:hypothetical protein
MQSTLPSSEYDAPDDYPLDDESMLFLMQEAGWDYKADVTGSMLINPQHQGFRVPADERGRTILNAFKMFLYITEHPFATRKS